jgi:hypothetical protein
VYLDASFDGFDLVVEIEGAHHDAPLNAVDDALRQNHLSTEATVLRIPVLGWRLNPDLFMAQVEKTLRSRGWRPTRSPSAVAEGLAASDGAPSATGRTARPGDVLRQGVVEEGVLAAGQLDRQR